MQRLHVLDGCGVLSWQVVFDCRLWYDWGQTPLTRHVYYVDDSTLWWLGSCLYLLNTIRSSDLQAVLH